MGKLLFKMIVLLIALVGWVIYSNMDNIKRYINDFEMPELSASSGDDSSAPTSVYKWQDASGQWHFSSKKPANATNAELKTYDGSNISTTPAPPASSSRSLEDSPLKGLVEGHQRAVQSINDLKNMAGK